MPMRMHCTILQSRIGLGAAILALSVTFLPLANGQIGRPEGLYYKSWGVVIGINDYLVAPKLTGSVESAKAVAAALRDLKFEEVLEVYDKEASSRRLHAILNDYLPRKVGRQDRVVIYFAGHAGTMRDVTAKEIGYLVPWDAQVTNATKAVSLDHLKEFSRRVMSKHILLFLDAPVSDWDVTPPQQLSLEGRLSPEDETDKRAVQVLAAATKGETAIRKDGRSVFAQVLLDGLKGSADADKNGWLMASELGAYVKQRVTELTGGVQHPQFARLDGDGDTVLVEGKKGAFRGQEPKSDAERVAAAKREYDEAFSLLQQQRPPEEALARLNKAIEYNPAYGDAYVLKSYIYLEMLPKLDEALVAGELAVKYAPENPDSHYTLGLVLQKKGQYAQAEKALLQAVAVNPGYTDVYLALGDLYATDLKDRQKSIAAYQRYLETGGTENRVRTYLEGAGTAPAAPTQ